MTIITLPADTYHKVGTKLDLDDYAAKAMIKKGFAEEVKEFKENNDPEQIKVKPKKKLIK